MRSRWTIFGSLLLAMVSFCPGETLDQLVAVVNRHPILQSDWDDELRFENFMSGRKPGDVGPEERTAALDRLIDQELLREQMKAADLKPTVPEQTEGRLEALKTDYLRGHVGQSWEAALLSYGLTEQFITSHIAAELDQLRLVESRFRSSIQVDAAEIDKYYREHLVPKLPSSDPVSLTEAAPKIREILIQQKMNQQLSSWLEILRSQAQIQMLSPDSTSKTEQIQRQ